MRQNGNLLPAVFLDRDGVINEALIRRGKPYSPRKLKDLSIIDGVGEAISLFHKNGFVTVVVTNQPDVARGYLSNDVLAELHSFISKNTGVVNFYICVHDDNDSCECRKPKIGLIQKASKDLNLDVSNSFMVGDRWKDIEAGQRAGCQCFYIDNKYSEPRPVPPFCAVTSLLEAAKIITEGIDGKQHR